MKKARMTQKFKKALHTAQHQNLPTSQDREWLYGTLNDEGFWWDCKQGEWVRFATEPSDEPTPLVMVRVWASETNIEEAVRVVEGAFSNGFTRILKSKPYPCRPPKQREHRVYLQFHRTHAMTKGELIQSTDPFAVEIA